MKRYKVILSLVLVLALMITGTAFGAVKEGITYTALGDSIAFGTGAEDFYGYTDMLNDHFTRIHGEGDFNKDAASGLASIDLLYLLTSESEAWIQQDVADSEVITISIGGNDLLRPFIMYFTYFINENYTTVYGLDYEQFIVDFTAWKNGNLEDLFLKAKFDKLFYDLSIEFTAGAGSFSYNFPIIMSTIRTMNPEAEIYVNTIYNPFTTDPMLHDFADPIIQVMNGIIVNESSTYEYDVVDVYMKFEEYNNPKKLAVGDLSNLVKYMMSTDYITPVPLHPTDKGHKFIFNLHKDLIE